VAWPGIPAKADLETQVVAKIVSTVRPRPEFRIGTALLPTGNVISVIRVLEGTYPPYEYEQGMSSKIPLRVHDTLKSANVREIDALFKRRNEGSPLSEQTILQYVNATGFDCTTPEGVQDLDFHRVVIVPRRKARLRLDSNFERELEFLIMKNFPQEQGISESSRRGDYLQFQAKIRGRNPWHHLWRVYENGAIGFTGSLKNDFPGGKPIGDLALDILSTCRLSLQLLTTFGIEGDVYLAQLLRVPSAVFLAKFPILPGTEYFQSDAIAIPELAQVTVDRSVYYQTLLSSDLAEPYSAIAEVLMYNLRETRQVKINYGRLLSQIERLKPIPTKKG
jgi:hypothetical protein